MAWQGMARLGQARRGGVGQGLITQIHGKAWLGWARPG
jgi:hypothetical protein